MRNANAALALLAFIAIRLREFFHELFFCCVPTAKRRILHRYCVPF